MSDQTGQGSLAPATGSIASTIARASMKWLRLLVVLCVTAVAVAVPALALVGPVACARGGLLRRELEVLLASALHTPVSIAALRRWRRPMPRDDVAIGEAALTASSMSRRRWPCGSLRQARPVVTASADGITVDVPGWAALPSRPDEPARSAATVPRRCCARATHPPISPTVPNQSTSAPMRCRAARPTPRAA